MIRLVEHHKNYHNSETHNELQDLANTNDQHEFYYKFRNLSGGALHHMKDRARQHLGHKHQYYNYPVIVFYDQNDNDSLKKFADPSMTHHHLVNHLEHDVSGGSWKSFKKIALGAMKVYHKINDGVGYVANLAKSIPINDPKYKAVVNALSAGTKIQDKVLTSIGAGL
jgi:hypothetical protein